MKFTKLPLKGAFIIDPELHEDNRGRFSRIFCKNELKNIGNDVTIVQANHSITQKAGTIRGMHYQQTPKTEIKLIKCIKGSIFDVIIDIRKGSSTFLKWFGAELSEKNMKMLYIPQGVAHGFQTLQNNTELLYFHSEFYSPDHEGAISYKDPMVGINWPIKVTEISKKDNSYPFIDQNFKGIKI